MSKDFNSLKSGATYFNKVMDFQARRDTPLLELSRMVLTETYMNALPLMTGVNPLLEAYVPERPLIVEAIKAGEVMHMASFNLTKHFGSTDKAMENIFEIAEVATRFHALNSMDYDAARGICAIVSQSTAEIDPKSQHPKSEIFLVCNPGAMAKDGWEKSVNNSEDKTKSRFFAHLINEGLITPQQVQDCNLNLGKYGHEIAAESQKLAAKAPTPGK